MYDVASAICGAAERGVAQRNVTPKNLGVGPDCRGRLVKFCAGKARSAAVLVELGDSAGNWCHTGQRHNARPMLCSES